MTISVSTSTFTGLPEPREPSDLSAPESLRQGRVAYFIQHIDDVIADPPHRPFGELTADRRPPRDETNQPPSRRHDLSQVCNDRSIELDLPQLCAHPPRQIVEIATVNAALAGDNITGFDPWSDVVTRARCRPHEAGEDASRSLIEELPRHLHIQIVARLHATNES